MQKKASAAKLMLIVVMELHLKYLLEHNKLMPKHFISRDRDAIWLFRQDFFPIRVLLNEPLYRKFGVHVKFHQLMLLIA